MIIAAGSACTVLVCAEVGACLFHVFGMMTCLIQGEINKSVLVTLNIETTIL
jgi:hypothetical protein